MVLFLVKHRGEKNILPHNKKTWLKSDTGKVRTETVATWLAYGTQP
jgi:hypothetical protein